MSVKWHPDDSEKILVAEKKGIIHMYNVVSVVLNRIGEFEQTYTFRHVKGIPASGFIIGNNQITVDECRLVVKQSTAHYSIGGR